MKLTKQEEKYRNDINDAIMGISGVLAFFISWGLMMWAINTTKGMENTHVLNSLFLLFGMLFVGFLLFLCIAWIFIVLFEFFAPFRYKYLKMKRKNKVP